MFPVSDQISLIRSIHHMVGEGQVGQIGQAIEIACQILSLGKPLFVNVEHCPQLLCVTLDC
eukprot:Gb_28412 [translate_table: standard]